MTAAVLLAGAAGVAAAAAIVELATGWARGRAVRARRAARGGTDDRARRAVTVLARLGRRLRVVPAPADLEARLAAAGRPLGLTGSDLMAVKTAAAVDAPAVAAPLAAAAPGRTGVPVLVAAIAGGYLAPDAWLWRRAGRRAAVIATELADVLDLLRVCVRAGLPTSRALTEVGRRHAGLLARELRAVAAAVALGVPRDAALDGLAGAAPVPAVHALVAAVRRSDRHGAPLAPALEALAADARSEQARALAEHAAKAAPKIQLAVAVLLVPAVMLLVGAAVLRAVGLR
ncbi:MAG TPA: type II secretion system F family protein [Capillimicrobium sp.]|nr:type II secretion system F family protein [Capillimicrobium sp.]